MEINVTAIERWVRQLATPVALILAGLVFVWAASKLEGLFGTPAVGMHTWALAVPLVGLIWAAWRLWQMYRWEAGDLEGGCLSCGGPMSQHDGRYGPYSRCRMCGDKREGWH